MIYSTDKERRVRSINSFKLEGILLQSEVARPTILTILIVVL